jgi:hypothetical protein
LELRAALLRCATAAASSRTTVRGALLFGVPSRHQVSIGASSIGASLEAEATDCASSSRAEESAAL